MTPTLNGHPVARLTFYAPPTGVWSAFVTFVEQPNVEAGAACTLVAGGLTMRGTVDSVYAGTDGAQRRCRVYGGAGGWRQEVLAKDYASATTRTLFADLLRATGEQAGPVFEPVRSSVEHFARMSEAASTSLETAVGEQWWVDWEGKTNVGPRPSASMARYTVESRDVLDGSVMLVLDDLTELAIGAVIDKGVDVPLTIREYEVMIDDGIHARCYVAGTAESTGELGELVRALVRQEIALLHQPARLYRVVGGIDTLELQPVDQSAGLPTLAPIEVLCAAGIRSQLVPGTECVVTFLHGSRTQPCVTGFAGAPVPLETSIEAVTVLQLKAAAITLEGQLTMAPSGGPGFVADGSTVTIGGATGPAAARAGDTVQLPASSVLSLVIPGLSVAGAPIACTLAAPALGIITSGSAVVDIA